MDKESRISKKSFNAIASDIKLKDQKCHTTNSLRSFNPKSTKKMLNLDIMEQFKPEVLIEAESVFKQFKQVEQYMQEKGKNPLSGDQYKQLIEKALEKLSPMTLQDYKACGIEFIPIMQENVPHIAKNSEGRWQVNLPTEYKNPVQGILRTIEVILQIEHAQDKVAPSPERRAMVTARVFEANEKLGKYGWDIQGYALAEKYHTDYYNSIHEAFDHGLISENTPIDLVRAIGYEKACEKLVEGINPSPDVPMIFPSFGPAAYFEERLQAARDGQRPVKVGTTEFDALIMKLRDRKSQGKDFTLTVNILPNKEIWVQPYFLSRHIKSMHAVNAQGNPSVWAGEVVIDGNNLLSMKDQSGHFRTIDENAPYSLSKFAISVFADYGYDTSKTRIEKAEIDSNRDLDYFLHH